MTDALQRCKNCDSPHLYRFRLDSDWGNGGSYSPVNPGSPEKDRPDVATLVCDVCGTVGDDIGIAWYPNPGSP